MIVAGCSAIPKAQGPATTTAGRWVCMNGAWFNDGNTTKLKPKVPCINKDISCNNSSECSSLDCASGFIQTCWEGKCRCNVNIPSPTDFKD